MKIEELLKDIEEGISTFVMVRKYREELLEKLKELKEEIKK